MSRPMMPTPTHVLPNTLGPPAHPPHQPLREDGAHRAAAAPRAGHDDPPGESRRAQSAAPLARFEQLREQGAEVLRLQRAAHQLFATRHALEFDGFSCVVERLMPQDQDAQRRLAGAIGVELTTLLHLADDRLDATEVPPQALVVLARAMSLDQTTFHTLLGRDDQRHAARTNGSMPRSASALIDVSAALDAAWARDAEDDPQP